jgi:hypothetical protein
VKRSTAALESAVKEITQLADFFAMEPELALVLPSPRSCARLRQRPHPDLVETDLQILLVDLDAQIAAILVVVFRQDQALHLRHARRAAGSAAAWMIQRRNAAKSRCSVRKPR